MHISKQDICVIIPTYNNDQTIADVINKVEKYTDNIIIVNDGSTDNTFDILQNYKDIELLSYDKNKGKGHALQKGFNAAIDKGYRYAITIDSDGQHNPEEIPLFVDCITKYPDSLIVGVRNFNIEQFPSKNRFANKFSNSWFTFFTDIELSDTQSGFRLYPIELLKAIKFYSKKYEYELEVIVKAAWRGINIVSVPINAYYPPAELRITHYRPFKDFTRISVLNVVLFFITILYIKPYKFLKNLNKKNIINFIQNNIFLSKDSNIKITASVMFGVFMGIFPIWGYQLITAILLAHLFKLNKFIVIVAANISIAPIIPIILYLSFITGGFILGNSNFAIINMFNINFEYVKTNLIQYIIGSVALGTILSLASGLMIFLLLKIFRKR